jgi:sec-independent protein translocase protein TatC
MPARTLTARWRPIVFGVFVFSALATPTGDPFTMLALAVPMTVLFGLATAVVCWRDAAKARRGASDGELSPDEASVLDAASYLEPAGAEAGAPGRISS